MDLNTVWFLLVGVLIIGYAILDGFDLGVGILHLFTKGEERRRVNMNAIGPVWDGNEVWLLTGGGALFAAFPVVYATVFSGFYLALMLLLFALILRAVSFEFRGKVDSRSWRVAWDWAFGLGSLISALLFGVAFGNILRGVPVDATGAYTGDFLGLLNPYSVLIGLLSVALFIMHGAIYLDMKTEGDHRDWASRIVNRLWPVVVGLYILATIATFFEAGFLFEGVPGNPIFWVLIVLLFGSILGIPFFVKSGKYFAGFIASSTTIASMIGLAALSLFPRLVPSRTDLAYSLTIYNASSTPRTLRAMLVIALVGMPIVIAYTIFVYRIFRGKVTISHESY
ncbi:MAG TPA: cytochrome d ubiquinol oxidase subunit II [Bacteroidota bacterium]|nr:cytochrome d ubiquinol oxidase subunit II [Bacteroidota bacterium]